MRYVYNSACVCYNACVYFSACTNFCLFLCKKQRKCHIGTLLIRMWYLFLCFLIPTQPNTTGTVESGRNSVEDSWKWADIGSEVPVTGRKCADIGKQFTQTGRNWSGNLAESVRKCPYIQYYKGIQLNIPCIKLSNSKVSVVNVQVCAVDVKVCAVDVHVFHFAPTHLEFFTILTKNFKVKGKHVLHIPSFFWFSRNPMLTEGCAWSRPRAPRVCGTLYWVRVSAAWFTLNRKLGICYTS